jgi:hypothetical protein
MQQHKNLRAISLIPRPSLDLQAFNVARKKREKEEGLVRNVTHVMPRIDSR